jgi:GntR family transcriptional repressor for pyruvate dehydrogenase complex
MKLALFLILCAAVIGIVAYFTHLASEDRKNAERLAKEKERAQLAAAEKAKIDAELHYYIAEITGNILIISVLNIISSIMEHFIQTSRSKIIENPNNQARLFKHHEDIVAAICDRDPDRAAEAMSEHMVMIDKIVFEND